VLPWLGENICRTIDAFLRDAGAANVTLVPCGPVTVAPLHAAPWEEEGAGRCLLERFGIRYAPSALLAGAALARAQQRQNANRVLVGLADPLGDLPAALPEVEEVGELFPAGRRKLAVRNQADSHFLQREARDASYLHLACHAQGGLFDQNEAGVELADRRVPPAELSGLGLRSRLVAVSACDSAVADIRNLPDEVSSIGTALLAAGSACAFASLWPVLDFTAALLMIRAYEEMHERKLRPPEALQRAQLWLRDLTEEETEHFLAAHPALEGEYRRRRRGPGTYHEEASRTAPYAHPDYWASFIAVGA
jgi:CHAT domain-containing protein